MTSRWRLAISAALALAAMGGCGGGDGNGAPNPPPARHATTFVGRLSGASGSGASLAALGGASAVQVCVARTSFCTTVDPDGTFTLAANVGGDVVLVFDGPSFSARLPLNDVPRGATVQIEDIICSTVTGECEAANVAILPAVNAPPDCSGAEARPAVLWPPNHQMVRIAVVGVVDPDGDPIAITATDVSQNEPVDAPGSGNTAPDAQLNPLSVRAERSGQGDGRLYVIDFLADDGRGGQCIGAVLVCVPHDRGNGSTCG